MKHLHELVRSLTPDPVRAKLGFSQDIGDASTEISEYSEDRERVIDLLRRWLVKAQPCRFGRIAAAKGMLNFCVITERDIERGDLHVKNSIQDARREWWKRGLVGESHGFIVLLASSQVALAEPNHQMQELARYFCALYLQHDALEVDRIYHDELFLRIPELGNQRLIKWLAGVNVFATAADRRWWNDHRIPGGLAFSANSVGHMVRSLAVRSRLGEVLNELGIKMEVHDHKLDTLLDALVGAMRTIKGASKGPWDAATSLRPIGPREDLPILELPSELPDDLRGYDYCNYTGFYHTDVCVPSSYFTPAVDRPSAVVPIELDLTYLLEDSVDNPAHDTMGKGVVIGGASQKRTHSTVATMRGEIVSLRAVPHLRDLR